MCEKIILWRLGCGNCNFSILGLTSTFFSEIILAEAIPKIVAQFQEKKNLVFSYFRPALLFNHPECRNSGISSSHIQKPLIFIWSWFTIQILFGLCVCFCKSQLSVVVIPSAHKHNLVSFLLGVSGVVRSLRAWCLKRNGVVSTATITAVPVWLG